VIRQNYVEGDKVSYRQLVYSGLKGMLSSLDPHSQFMEPESYNEMRSNTQGEFTGLGIVITSKDGAIVVVTPMEDTPGFRAGILPGDKILKIEGKGTDTMQLSDAVKKLRGKPGDKVMLTIFRPKTKEVKEFTLVRENIKVESVKDINSKQEFPLSADGIGYIRITQFNEPTADEFERALNKLDKQGMQGLVIDLRNNPGGLLESAIDICSKFVSGGKLVVSTAGRGGINKQEYKSHGSKVIRSYPIAILINGGSASASEIVSGCLQDYKRSIVIGETSFGKGSVQSVIANDDGSAIRLTTAKYYTPSHKTIHEKGVSPDIVVAVTEEDERRLLSSRVPTGEDNQEKVSDSQMNRAIDVLKGIRIYANRTGKTPEKPVPPPTPAPSSKR